MAIILKNNKITLRRSVENNEITTYVDIQADIDCFIYPLGEDVLIGNDGIGAYEGYKILCDYLDIRTGDEIIDKDNKSYIVRGAKRYDNSIEKHSEAILVNNFNDDE